MTLTALVAGALPATPKAGAAETLRVKREQASPGTVFFAAGRKAGFRYEIGGSKPRNVRVEVVNRRLGRTIRTWRRSGVEPGVVHSITWNGTRTDGRAGPRGRYGFRVRARSGAAVDRAEATGNRRFVLRPHKFPVRGRHRYGDGTGARRGHQGQDVFARCGTKVVAARAGRVQHRGRHGRAGHYVVIDGRGTGRDYVYMHLRPRVRVRRGERVRTGQRIGRVGASGNASGCHLHFELWSAPGWYEGGTFMRSVTRQLRLWDRWG